MRNIVRPIIGFEGTEGSGKTTCARFFRSVFDPSSPDLNSFKRKESEISLILYQNAVPILDNLRSLPVNIVDMLCKATTGEGFSKRTLYTDSNLTTYSYRRPIIYTALRSPSSAPDFLDRKLTIKCKRISNTNRKSETDLWDDFNNDLSIIRGGILDLIHEALTIMPKLKITNLPRLADFAIFGTAVSLALGYKERHFVDLLSDTINSQKLDNIISQEPVADAMIKLIHDVTVFNGRTSDLYNTLNNYNSDDYNQDRWPRNPESLGAKLKNDTVIGILKDYGIKVRSQRIAAGKMLTIFLESAEDQSDSVSTEKNESKYDPIVKDIFSDIFSARNSENPQGDETEDYGLGIDDDAVDELVSDTVKCCDCDNLIEVDDDINVCSKTRDMYYDNELKILRICDDFAPKGRVE
jgi:hypothetical protein